MCSLGSIATVLFGENVGQAVTADQALKQQKTAQKQAQTAAAKTEANAENATNRANAVGPDSASLLSANMMAGANGQASTMLTGPQGVDPSTLTLGKSSMLGG